MKEDAYIFYKDSSFRIALLGGCILLVTSAFSRSLFFTALSVTFAVIWIITVIMLKNQNLRLIISLIVACLGTGIIVFTFFLYVGMESLGVRPEHFKILARQAVGIETPYEQEIRDLQTEGLLSDADPEDDSEENIYAFGKTKVERAAYMSVLCLDEGHFISEPQNGTSVCTDEYNKWEDLSNTPFSWGGCEFLVNRAALDDPTNPDYEGVDLIRFCATSTSGEVLTCSEQGCKSSYENE